MLGGDVSMAGIPAGIVLAEVLDGPVHPAAVTVRRLMSRPTSRFSLGRTSPAPLSAPHAPGRARTPRQPFPQRADHRGRPEIRQEIADGDIGYNWDGSCSACAAAW